MSTGPIFIVSSPRSNARRLFDALSQSPDVEPRPGAARELLEQAGRAPVSATVADAIRARYHLEARRAIDASPVLSQRVALLAAIFPDAQFVYVYRDPSACMSDMFDAGRIAAEDVPRQWANTTTMLLDDLERLPAERWAVISEDSDLPRLCAFLGIAKCGAPEPLQPQESRSLPDAWAAITDAVAARARDFFANAPRDVRPPAPEASAFRSIATSSLAAILQQLGVSLLVTTYQSGRVVLVRAQDGSTVNTHFRMFRSPMGVAIARNRIALGTEREVWDFRNMPDVARKLQPPGLHDACFIPRNVHYTGDIRIHEVGFAADGELWVVNTRFSTLCTLDRDHSFVPRWRPPFVTHLAPEDRCHLNGMAMVDGAVRYVSALAATNEAGAWRQHKRDGGIIMEVPSGNVVVRGLSMPHSPRLHDGRLWFLESGKGELNCLRDGGVETIAELPGFTRGLAFAGPFAFVGLSQVRESNIFGGIELTERVQDRRCGVWVIDLRNRTVAAFLQFEGDVREIFDVQVLPMRYPELLDGGDNLVSVSYVLPDEALRDVAQ